MNKNATLLAITLILAAILVITLENKFTGFSTADNETSDDSATQDQQSPEDNQEDTAPSEETTIEEPQDQQSPEDNQTNEEDNSNDLNQTEPPEDNQESNETEELNLTVSEDINSTSSENITETNNAISPNQEISSDSNISNLTQINQSNLNVTSIQINTTDTGIISEETTPTLVVINRPVKWKKTVKLSNETNKLEVEIPKVAENIKVNKIKDNSKEEINPLKIDIEGEDPQLITLGFSWLEYVFNKVFKATGYATLTDEENKTLTIADTVEEIEIEYETPAPIAIEEEISDYQKRITISSDIPYENILTFMEIKESPKEAVKLYWLKDGKRELFEDVTYYDENDNGLIDLLEWITPHLSSQIFEVEINILNVQSYPQQGSNWTVEFNTTGTADLTITPINGTTFGSEYPADLEFLELDCGTELLNPDLQKGIIFYSNFTCNTTSYETSKAITSGHHYLQFDYGGMSAIAQNYASGDCSGIEPPTKTGNWNISSNTVCQNTYINFEGNLTVNNGYSLTLQNVTLMLNSSYSLEHEVRAISGSTLIIEDLNDAPSNISSNNSANHIRFISENGATLELKNSQFNYIGKSGSLFSYPLNNRGIYIASDSSIITGNSIYNNDAQSHLVIISDNNVISNNDISNNLAISAPVHNSLIYLENADNNTISNNNLNNNKGDLGRSIASTLHLVNSNNNTISNNNLQQTTLADSYDALTLNSSNYTNINNNNIYETASDGIVILDSSFVNIYDQTIFSVGDDAMSLSNSNNNSFNNITILGDNLDTTYGVTLTSSSYNIFKNINIQDTGVDGFYILTSSTDNYIYNTQIANAANRAIRIKPTGTVYIIDSILTNSVSQDVRTTGAGAKAVLLNTSFSTTSNAGDMEVQWHLNLNVNDSNGNNLQGINVSVWNNTHNLVFSELTNADGNILNKNLTEYLENSTSKYYSTNYTINTTYQDYPVKTQQLNITSNKDENIAFISHSTPSPVSPTNNTFTQNGTLSLLWSNSTKGDHSFISYLLEIDNNQDFSSPEYRAINITETASPTSNTTTLNNDTYYWRVLATDNYLNSSFSNVNMFTIDSIFPIVTLISPLNNRADRDGNLTFDYNVTDTNSIANCTLILNSLFNETNSSISVNITQNITLNNLAVGKYNWTINCTDYSLNSHQPDSWNFSVVLFKQFTGQATTDLEAISIKNISHFVIEQSSFGKINFTDNIDLSNGTDIDMYLNISNNRIALDSNYLPELNKTAELSFYGLSLINPTPLRDNLPCPSSVCSSTSYTNNTFTMQVTGFSTYTLAETSSNSQQNSQGHNSRMITINSIEIPPMYNGKTHFISLVINNEGPRTENNIFVNIPNCPLNWKCQSLTIAAIEENNPTKLNIKVEIPSDNYIYETKLNFVAKNEDLTTEKSIPIEINPICNYDYECSNKLCLNNICQSAVSLELDQIDSQLDPGSDLDFEISVNNNINLSGELTLEYYLDNDLLGSKKVFMDKNLKLSESIKLNDNIIGNKTFTVKAYINNYSDTLSKEILVLNNAPVILEGKLSILDRFVNKRINYQLTVTSNKDSEEPLYINQKIFSDNKVVYQTSYTEGITKKLELNEDNIKLAPGEYTLKITISNGLKKQTILKSFIVNSTVITQNKNNIFIILAATVIIIISSFLFSIKKKNGKKPKRHKRSHRKKH